MANAVNCRMDKKPVYSIGHGTRAIEALIAALKAYGVAYLADVRSRPYSRFNPQYNRKALQQSLQEHGITYVFMGDELGGRPTDPGCYDAAGRIDYEKVKQKAFFREGIRRLKTAYEKNIAIAVLCSESKPAECHRSKLIGTVLLDEQVAVLHIDEHYQLKTQQEVMTIWQTPGTPLFPDN